MNLPTNPLRLHLDDQLCFALYAATNAVMRVYRPMLAPLGITYPQYLVLVVLWQHGPQPVGSIADRLDLPSHAVSPIVTRLEAVRLVSRTVPATDRRRTDVHLTGAGQKLEAAAAEAQRVVACQTGLAPAAFDSLRVQLHELVRNLDETTSGDLRRV